MKMPAVHAIRGIFAFVLALILLSQVAVAVFAWNLFQEQLAPEMNRKATTIGLSIKDKLLDATDDGVPFDRLEGVEDYFAQVMAGNRDIAWIVLLSTDGTVLDATGLSRQAAADLVRPDANVDGKIAHRTAQGRDADYAITAVSVDRHGTRFGVLDLGVSQSFIDARVGEIRLDVIIVVVISLLVAFEVMLFIISASLQEPLNQVWSVLGNVTLGDFREISGSSSSDFARLADRVNALVLKVNERMVALRRAAAELGRFLPAGRADALLGRVERRFQVAPDGRPRVRRHALVVQVRILTFLFMFAEMLSRPFLPLMARSILPHWAKGETADFLSGMPISAFMAVAAIGMPIAGRWSDRIGHRRTFLYGALAITIGLLGAAFSFSIYDFTAWRMVSAAGYASMFIACQGFVMDNTGERDRARGIANFVGAIMVSEVCAPAIGGILADRVGYQPVFALGAAVAIVSGVIGHFLLRRHERRRPKPAEEVRESFFNWGPALRNPRFVVLLIFAAIPAKMLLTGFLFYLVPVVLTGFGATQAEIGRIVMAYGVPSLLLTPVFAALVDRFKCHGLMVGLGGIVAGAGMLPVLFRADSMSVLIGVAGLGIGQAMSISPQLAMVSQICQDEIAQHGQTSILGLFRFVERLGAASGSLVAAALVGALLGPVEAMAALGALSIGCAVVFSVIFLVFGTRRGEPLDALDAAPSPGAAE